MAEIKRTELFGKLDAVAYKAVESATVFCKMRGNPYVELVHWLNQIIGTDETDMHLILRHFEADASRLSADLVNALDALPRGASSIRDFSPQIELAIKEAWMLCTLLYKRSAIRTGDLLLACVRTPELRRTLQDLSPQFMKIKAEELSDHFYSITTGSREEGSAAADGTGLAQKEPGTENGAMAPAEMGKQEALKQYCTDLTEEARAGRLDPVVGRDAEVRRMIDVLLRRRQNNPILTGEAGVGKTAVVEGLALRIASGDIPDMLKDVRLLSLDLQGLQAGASMRGEFENRLKQVIDEVHHSPTPIIMFIDEAHNLVGAGGQAGQGDAANLLKPALARGTFRCIAATTWSEYKKYFEKDPALTRRFQNILIEEPDDEKAHLMMIAVGRVMAKHHHTLILDEALRAAVTLSRRYLPTRQLPDKAVSLLDTASARVAFSQSSEPAEVEDLRREIEGLDAELDVLGKEARMGQDRAAALESLNAKRADAQARYDARVADWEQEKELVGRVVELRNALQDGEERTEEETAAMQAELREKESALGALQGESPLVLPQVDAQAIAAIISEWTGIPAGRMVSNELENILKLSDTLGERVVGQDHGLRIIADRILSARASLADPEKPIAVLMLAGPSGVGKTETALALAESLYGGEQNLITINMSEFQEAHTVSTLKGAPPGYVGYGEGGVLTEAVRRKPYSVVLLDEVEKAHKDVHEIFFQVFDKGRMEDGEGRLIDFRNTVILLTTNAGTDEMAAMCSDPELMPPPEQVESTLHDALLKVFPPALLGRIVVIPYYPLSQEVMNKIVGLKLGKVAQRLKAGYGAELSWGPELGAHIMEQAKRADAGARIIDNIITHSILPRLSSLMLQSVLEHKAVSRVAIAVQDGQIDISAE
ncbi:MAG: type VI secretion system ATPase TssH [Akkermansia sp.]|nr:type VI secretion system ATPase TssH [Akkermansia sp.]